MQKRRKAQWPNGPIYGKGVVKPSVQGTVESSSAYLPHLSRLGGRTLMDLLPYSPWARGGGRSEKPHLHRVITSPGRRNGERSTIYSGSPETADLAMKYSSNQATIQDHDGRWGRRSQLGVGGE